MGVDIQTYRACIGSFKHTLGHDVVTQTVFVDIPLFRRLIMSMMLFVSVLVVLLLGSNVVMKIPRMSASSSQYEWNKTSDITKNVTRNVFAYTAACAVCLKGSVSFIGMLLLMAGVEPNPGPNDGGNHQGETTETKAHSLLRRLGLVDFYPNKIKLFDVISISKQDNGSIQKLKEVDLPWTILRRLVSTNSNATCFDIPEGKEGHTVSEWDDEWDNEDVSKELDDEDVSNELDDEDAIKDSDEFVEPEVELNYLNVFLLTFLCCDPMLKQLLIQKMFLCKFAVPFLYIPINRDKPVISLWPLRGLVVETSFKNNRIREYNVFDLPTKCVAFCRLWRPHFSKSRLLNRLISNENSKTFYYRSSECDNVSSGVCKGYIESFWLSTSGTDQDKFDEPIMFLNMRGSVRDCGTQTIKFLSKFVDTLVLIIQKEEFINSEKYLENIVSSTRSVIIVITGNSAIKISDSWKKIHSKAKNNNCMLSYVTTYDKRMSKTEDRIEREIIRQINVKKEEENLLTLAQRLDECSATVKDTNEQLKGTGENRFNQCNIGKDTGENLKEAGDKRSHKCTTTEIATDEQYEGCVFGKEKAIEICKTMKLDENFASLQKHVAPNQSKISPKLGKLLKELKREKNIHTQDEKRIEIRTLREEITRTITQPIRHFVQVLGKFTSLDEIEYFLGWLGFFISRNGREVLLELKSVYKTQWSIYHEEKKKQTNQDHAKDKLRSIESQIHDASFSVGHLFREIGIVYDSILELGIQSNTLELPSENEIAALIGKLIANGRQYELIDGESLYLPYKWLSKLFTALDKELNHKIVKTISVLGVQSSGKSTLLNIMFGALFSTSASRCTRGIHAQLIPLHRDFVSEVKDAFQYILILDTEGLRPTEVVYKDLGRDNELATLITGLGNITIVNVMGENTQEIQDILQIVAHAFLRINLANKDVNLYNRCILVQQNISSSLADDQMNEELMKLVESLDEMTKDSAQCEGSEDIRTFNKVIKFDHNSDVWYMKNVWHGDPPVARVNSNYCEKARSIKLNLFKHDVQLHDSSYKTIDDFIVQTNDLYQGILHENFVFSFKNSLEKRAYLKMDEFIHDQLWQIEFTLTTELNSTTRKMFSKCREIEEVDVNRNQIESQLNTMISEQTNEMENHLISYFNSCEHPNIVVQWKESQQNRVQVFFKEIKYSAERTIQNEMKKTKTNLRFYNSRLESANSLQRQTLEYAENNPVKDMTDEDINNLFEVFWNKNFANADPATSVEYCNFKEILIKCLHEIHGRQKPVLDIILKQMDWCAPWESLDFNQTGIVYDDVHTWLKLPKLYRQVTKANYDAVKDAVTSFLRNVGKTIDDLCKENDELQESHARKFLCEVNKRASNEISKIKVEESTYIKIDVHVSIVAKRLFEEHNRKYRQTLREKFDAYKRQQKVLFQQLFKHRQTENAVANIIADVIFKYLQDETVDRLANELKQRLRADLPRTKNLLIIDICTDFVNSGKFSDIISYISNPMKSAQLWFERKAKSCLYDGTSSKFSECSVHVIEELYSNVLKSLEHLQTTDDEMASLPVMVENLSLKLNEGKIFIPETEFSSILRNNQAAKINLKAVSTAIADKLKELKFKISFTKDTDWWKENFSFEDVFERVWGCTKCCPYCQEPCQNSSKSHIGDHRCVQHRPKCCHGLFWIRSRQASVETCNYSVQSRDYHKCNAFGFKCNDELSECSKGTHYYAKYRKILKDWYIPPSADMHDSSKFWLWFVGKFKNELAEEFYYKVDVIPASWSKITAEDAKESLRSFYG